MCRVLLNGDGSGPGWGSLDDVVMGAALGVVLGGALGAVWVSGRYVGMIFCYYLS